MKGGDLLLLEGLWLARTPLQRQAFSQRYFGGNASVQEVEQMQALLGFVVGLAHVPKPDQGPWQRLEELAGWLSAAEGEATLRSPDQPAPTLAAETEASPSPWPQPEPVSPRIESAPIMVRSVVTRVVSDVEDETLQGGKAPVQPAVLLGKLLDEGDTHRALEIYAALCAATDAAPDERARIHVPFGLFNEAQRRALDDRFEGLFDREPSLREIFAARVRSYTDELGRGGADGR